ncbi:MAG: DUF5050 domain-containing protein [Clostridia bacterium]|nr:DUF5050 domain-containing protein [Clostridia bacterium]
MKNRWIAILLSFCCLCAGLTACTDEEILPQEQPDQVGQEGTDEYGFLERVENDIPIDATRYDENDYAVTIMGKDQFINVHGMVLFKDQDNYFPGNGLCYVNKASKVASIFCVDALCDYELGWCTARFFGGMSMMTYSPADGKLYGSRADAVTYGSNDGNLYSMTVDTMETKKVFTGNGNELRFFQVQGDYVYVTRNRKEGGFEHIRYNVKTEKAEILTPPEGKIFSNLWVGNRHMIVMFMDEFELYKVNEAFDTYEKLDSNVTGVSILHGDYIYGSDTLDDDTVNYFSYNIMTKEKHVFANNTEGLAGFHTVSDGYLYLLDDNRTCLYRISIEGENNQPELVFDTTRLGEETQIRGMKRFDGDIYFSFYVKEESAVIGKITRFGNLVRGENGWEFVDFKQGNVLG